MRIFAPIFIVVGLFIAVDKGFGLLADRNQAKRAEMMAGGREMYAIAEDVVSDKPLKGAAKTRIGTILQNMVAKVHRLETDFEKKYGPLYELMNDPKWLMDKARIASVLPLTKSWAKDAVVLWKKEKGLQGAYMDEMAAELKVSKKSVLNRPNVQRSIRSFDMYKQMIDEGRVYFEAVEDYLAFAHKHHKLIEMESGQYYFLDSKIHARAGTLEKEMLDSAQVFMEAGKAFDKERAEIRKDAMRTARTALAL